jgi:hypothetical protein
MRKGVQIPSCRATVMETKTDKDRKALTLIFTDQTMKYHDSSLVSSAVIRVKDPVLKNHCPAYGGMGRPVSRKPFDTLMAVSNVEPSSARRPLIPKTSNEGEQICSEE